MWLGKTIIRKMIPTATYIVIYCAHKTTDCIEMQALLQYSTCFIKPPYTQFSVCMVFSKMVYHLILDARLIAVVTEKARPLSCKCDTCLS